MKVSWTKNKIFFDEWSSVEPKIKYFSLHEGQLDQK